MKLPARSPNLNAYAERFVRSIKPECLSQVIPLGQRHLRAIVSEYTDHYHAERNHQGLDNQLIVNTPPPKGGGFGLRLKAGLVGHAADSRTT